LLNCCRLFRNFETKSETIYPPDASKGQEEIMRKLLAVAFCGCLLVFPVVLMAVTTTAQDYDDQGLALLNRGLYEKAIGYFNSATQADPSDWQAYENMGNAYVKLNNNQAALAAYQKSLQINPNNTTLSVMVENLKNSTSASAGNGPANNPPVPGTGNQNNWSENEPVQNQNSTIVAQPRQVKPAIDYKDGLSRIDHAKFWTKLQLGYSYSQLDDLTNAANNINKGTYTNADPNLPLAYKGNSISSNNGLHLGAELGFLLNPYMGLAIGVKGLAFNNYTANVAYQNSFADYENETLSPYLVPLTLDYYVFLPDAGGRFYLKAGVGYYVGDVHMDETYSYSNFYNQHESTQVENWVGDLYSGNVGFQVGVGREFAITNRLGVELYAQWRYAKLSNFRGTVVDQYGNSSEVALVTGATNGVVDFDSPASVGAANGENYTTLDFTGFDAGFSLNFYSF